MSGNNNKVYENVIYKGEPGTLTLTPKVFHYEANGVFATVKCAWSRVDKRQLSPPGSNQPMLKLLLVSGKSCVFNVASTNILLDLVKDVKIRMESSQQNKPATAAKEQVKEQPPAINIPKKRPSVQPFDNYSDEWSPGEDWSSGEEVESPRRKRNSQPPKDDDKGDDDSSLCCSWDSLFCWLILGATILVGVAIFLIVYFLFIKGDGGSNSNSKSKKPKPRPADPYCEDPNSPQCPPSWKGEDMYGIRAVEYVWTPEFVRLEYYISDYILDTSVGFELWSGVKCRNSTDELVPEDNEWIRVDLVDGAPTDGGANLYNEGRGTRQFDLVLEPRANVTTLRQAPFYYFTNEQDRALLRVCVTFVIHYNKVETETKDFQESIEVNYIENALQLSMATEDAEQPTIHDVQIKTRTRPAYKL